MFSSFCYLDACECYRCARGGYRRECLHQWNPCIHAKHELEQCIENAQLGPIGFQWLPEKSRRQLAFESRARHNCQHWLDMLKTCMDASHVDDVFEECVNPGAN